MKTQQIQTTVAALRQLPTTPDITTVDLRATLIQPRTYAQDPAWVADGLEFWLHQLEQAETSADRERAERELEALEFWAERIGR